MIHCGVPNALSIHPIIKRVLRKHFRDLVYIHGNNDNALFEKFVAYRDSKQDRLSFMHEAGYDAFMTGCVFAQACSHLGIKLEINTPMSDFTTNAKIKSYINLLYPSWNSGTVINLSTGIESLELGYNRKYPTVVFSSIVLIWGFPAKLTPNDLKDCISKVFGTDSPTSVFFLDSTAVLVQFSKKEFVNDFLIVKDTLERDDDAIAALHPLGKLLEGGNTCASSYETYKEICGSSLLKVRFADQAKVMGIKWKTKLKLSRTEDNSDSLSVVKQSNEKKIDHVRSHHQVSCEEILSSLCASKLSYGKHMRSA